MVKPLAWAMALAGVGCATIAGVYFLVAGEEQSALAVAGFIIGAVGYVLGVWGFFISIRQVDRARRTSRLLAEITIIEAYLTAGLLAGEPRDELQADFEKLWARAGDLSGSEEALRAIVPSRVVAPA